MTTQFLDPVAALNTVWDVYTAANINDGTRQPSVPGGSTVYDADKSGNLAQQWSLTDLSPVPSGTVHLARLWYYVAGVGSGLVADPRLQLGGVWYTPAFTSSSSSGWLWADFQLPALSTDTGISGNAFEFTSPAMSNGDISSQISGVYVAITVNVPASGSPADWTSRGTDIDVIRTRRVSDVFDVPAGTLLGNDTSATAAAAALTPADANLLMGLTASGGGRTLSSQNISTTSFAIENTTTETSLISTASPSTWEGDATVTDLVAGDAVRFTAGGQLAVSSPGMGYTCTMRVKLGGQTIVSAVLDEIRNFGTAPAFSASGLLVVHSVGPASVVQGSLIVSYVDETDTTRTVVATGGVSTLDLSSGSADVDITAQWSVANTSQLLCETCQIDVIRTPR